MAGSKNSSDGSDREVDDQNSILNGDDDSNFAADDSNKVNNNQDNGENVSNVKLSELVSKFKVLQSELELSAEFVNSAIDSKDKIAAESELTDLNRLEKEYFDHFQNSIVLCDKLKIPSDNIIQKRKEFSILLKKTKNSVNQILSKSVTQNSSNSVEPTTKRLKFSKIEFDPFDGKDLEKWNSFKKLFVTYIHDSKELSDLEKHQFLQSKVRGDAATLVDSYPIDGSFYQTAWEVLLHHYDDPLKKISRHLDAILKISPAKGFQLRNLVTQFRAQVAALSLTFKEKPEIDVLSQVAIHLFLSKADKGARLEWEREIEKRQTFTSFEEFIVFMEGRCNAYERANSNSSVTPTKSSSFVVNNSTPTAQAVYKCFYCDGQHKLHQCQKFLSMSPEARCQSIRKRRLCPKCFRGRCDRQCRFKCTSCQGHHNTLLHYARPTASANISNNAVANPSTGPSNNSSNGEFLNHSCSLVNLATQFVNQILSWTGFLNENDHNLLATALVNVIIDNIIIDQVLRALLDPGSNFNLISAELVRKLNLPLFAINHQIYTIGNLCTLVKFSTMLNIKSRNSSFELNIKCLVVENIAEAVPATFFSIENWTFPQHLTLADPNFNIPQPVDLLLGAGVFWKVLKPQTMKIKNITSKIFASQFGWLVAGEMANLSEFHSSSSFFVQPDNFGNVIERLWFFDNQQSEIMTQQEIECEEHFLKTYKRILFGTINKFKICLPMSIPREQLGESKRQALLRFFVLEKKFEKDEKYKMEYQTEIHSYITQCHAKLIPPNTPEPPSVNYIPHRMVVKNDSTSSKNRLVWDASEPTTSGLSLNDCLMIGPVVQSDLISILLRSRLYKFLIAADITQMYRQILIDENDTPLLRFLWRDNPNENIQTYELITLPFGLSSSPYIATRCLKVLAENADEIFKKGKLALLHDCYVDNIFTGADTLEETIEIKNQLSELLFSGGFYLKKWCANDKRILTGIPPENLEKKFPLHFGTEYVIKTLGVIWDPETDCYNIWIHVKQPISMTKRNVLSISASIFDPFGILSPITIRARIFLQQLWELKIKWDEILPNDIIKIWSDFEKDLEILKQISIPRCIYEPDSDFIEIHGFSDASEKAYGGAIYLRVVKNGIAFSHLYYAKTRVTPIKKVSMARLELCGALVLTEILQTTLKSLALTHKIKLIRLWSDSQISLCWINSIYSRWLPFVANRVKKIQENQAGAKWDYISTDQNPADLLSRGLTAEQLKSSNLWWHGPTMLTLNADPFSEDIKFQPTRIQPPEIRQERKTLVFSIFKTTNSHILNFSHYLRLIRVTAWMIRFIWNLHWCGPYLEGPLQYFEIRQALYVIIKVVQKEYFYAELKNLEKCQNVDSNSRLSSLNPFLDHLGVIRVGGRLQNSYLSFEQKYPIVLPNNHHFTKLLIKHEHERNLHASIQSMRSILRRNFWILRQNVAIQLCILKCVKCIRLKADTKMQMMAALPKSRVTPARAFERVGVDYAGPVRILYKPGRGKHQVEKKAYISVFVCFTTKAIHLELISDLTTECFMAAFERFIGRRGLPLEIWSDNGTTFVGASKKLKELFEFHQTNKNELVSQITIKGITWHFTPPYGPSFGGLWEAGVKSVKSNLLKAIGDSLLTFEQYDTLLIRIEACLNSRPLCVESNDPNDLNSITPGHFLIGGPLTALPNPDLSEIPVNRLKYWQLTTKKFQEFWKRWSNEYLNQLQQRYKWKKDKNEIKKGDVVIVKDDNTPPLHWPLAQIVEIHPGKDGIIRVVTVRMRTNPLEKLNSIDEIKFATYKRPVQKLIYLPDPSQDNF